MKRIFLITACLSGFLNLSLAQLVLKEPLSNRQTGYSIDARLDTAAKIVYGRMTTFWVNMSKDNVSDVQLHLYLNAFRNRESTYFKRFGGMRSIESPDSGWIDIDNITDKKGRDLSQVLEFISPDDDNPHDRTVLRINLPEACRQGDTVFLNIEFRSKLPGNIRRTGYSDDFFFVAQWFPKFGVYETPGMRYAIKGGWNCHQFHAESEFYANHSVYDVRITVPAHYIVGSGGLLLDETVNADSTRTHTFRAEDIVDFAWTAWPGYSVFTDEWKHVRLTLLIPPERKNQVARQFQAVKNALQYLDEHVGPYPWPHLTFVDPPMKGSGAGGMEYTTLFTTTSFLGVPEFFRLPQMVTIHEFGHSYFMGMMASNEFEEPWLDEGVNTYWEGRIVDHYYGSGSGLIGPPLPKVSDRAYIRLSYTSSEGRQAATNAEYSWNFPHGTYGMMSYHKAGVIFQTLEGIIGQEMMDEIFREYYRSWAFRHPSGKDFINTANEVYSKSHGSDLNFFFDQTIYGTEICDYKVSGFHNSLEPGIDTTYRAVAELERLGGIMLPVEVLIHFDNGEEVRETWDGISRTKDFIYTGKRKIAWVKIDPEYRIMMDVNYINNSLTDDPDRIPVRRFNNKLITFLQFFTSLISL